VLYREPKLLKEVDETIHIQEIECFSALP